MNIKDLLEEDNFSCKKRGNHDGGVYGSSCPWCGGDDRFRCWPHADNGGNYYCQKCGRKGSAARYMVEYRKVKFKDACLFLGYLPKRRKGGLRKKDIASCEKWQPRDMNQIPSDQWQSQAKSLIQRGVDTLWYQCPDVRNWLHQRGLKDETIRRFSLGWIATDQWHTRESWDLQTEIKYNGNPKKLWIPTGLVIPCEVNGNIHRIRIRKAKDVVNSKYHLIKGSSSIPAIIGNLPFAILVESELDAFLVNQEIGDLITAVALGSAQIRPDRQLTDFLNKADNILIALDSDKAGASSYWSWWKTHFPRSKRWPPINGKDPTEAYQNGLKIRDWILAGLSVSNQSKSNNDVETISSCPRKFPDFDNHEVAIGKLRELKNSSSVIMNLQMTGRDAFTDEIAAIQIYGSPGISLNLDFRQLPGDVITLLSELLLTDCRKVFHDAKAQLKFLKKAGIEVWGNFFDTMLAAQLLDAGIKKTKYDLESLSGRYLSDTNLSPIETIKQLTKCLISELKTQSLAETAELEFSCLPAVVEMELNGVALDCDKWNVLGDELIKRKKKLEKSLYSKLGDINLDYPKDLLTALKSKGIDLPNTKRHTFVNYKDQYPILNLISEYRKVAKLVHAFIIPIPKFVNDKTGRIHTECNQLGASTGRFSCKSPNLQQMPRDKLFRSCIIAPSGYRLIMADYSQIELRIAAEVTGDETMIKAYQIGLDLHRLTASIILGKPVDLVTKQERQAAKAVNFGLIFAMGAEGLMNYAQNIYGVHLTIQQAQDFIGRFFGAYQGIANWHRNARESLAHETRTLGNRRRLWNASAPLTEILNTPIQGTSADILKRALSLLPGALTVTDSRIIACVHDEIILETPTNNAEEASHILVQTMIAAGEYYLKNVSVDVDVTVSDNWAGK